VPSSSDETLRPNADSGAPLPPQRVTGCADILYPWTQTTSPISTASGSSSTSRPLSIQIGLLQGRSAWMAAPGDTGRCPAESE
jgi:hypothetical protein